MSPCKTCALNHIKGDFCSEFCRNLFITNKESISMVRNNKTTEEKPAEEVVFRNLADGDVFSTRFVSVKDVKTQKGVFPAAYFIGVGEDEGIVFSTFSKVIVEAAQKSLIDEIQSALDDGKNVLITKLPQKLAKVVMIT